MRLNIRHWLQQIESRPREGSGSGSGNARGRVSTLSLVDLAGSESAKLNTQGERQLEGSFINKSLLTLGHIIYKLTEEDRPQRRDSCAASRKCLLHTSNRKSLVVLSAVTSSVSKHDQIACSVVVCTGTVPCMRSALKRINNLALTQHLQFNGIAVLPDGYYSDNASAIAIICTITPAVANLEETKNTLKFASRAKRIKSSAQHDRTWSGDMINAYQ
eukprot:11727-Heterococcus_DN1.PRE.1